MLQVMETHGQKGRGEAVKGLVMTAGYRERDESMGDEERERDGNNTWMAGKKMKEKEMVCPITG